MKKFIYDVKRTHRCGAVRESDTGKTVVLMGWVQHRRDHGGCVFIDLRDREGIVQVVFDPQVNPEAHKDAGALRSEWCLAVEGKVRSRGGNTNPRLATGTIEVAATRIEIFAQAKTPPFMIDDHVDTAEEVRLQYRYLDLRRPSLQHNLITRHKFAQLVRRTLDNHGFLELETPFLIKSTPEGARDYVVPSRVNPGNFFALPQSPQLFKQLFMVSGYDRYFQIARCFRDEDLRAERQPEFTQVDMEMSFCSPEDVQNVVEELLAKTWKDVLGVEVKTPFERIDYDDSMSRFGVDAPDMRFGLELHELNDIVKGSGFKVFADTVAAGNVVKAVNLTGVGELSRKDLDDYTEFVKIYGAKGMAWIRIKDGGEWQSPIAKFLSDAERAGLQKALDLKVGDVAVFVADTKEVANAALGNLRKHVAKQRSLVKPGTHRFCWVTEFPLFDYDAETKRYTSAHHPFTAPRIEDRDRLLSDPGSVKAQAYDIVLNGVEIGGGSIRIHDSTMQQEVFTALGISAEEQRVKFGFLLDALSYGAPPHGGLALGVDRICMQLCGTQSIRDVIAFPKTQKQTDLMLDAPSTLDPAQLTELCLRVTLPPKKDKDQEKE
jgi:aspartyl-tRNA synthetase